jgi:rhodanese-related sulfurtransferase
VLLTDSGREEEAVMRCVRIGYYNVMGYLEGGWATYVKEGGAVGGVNIVPLGEFLKGDGFFLLDVRKPDEFNDGHFAEATNIPLQVL